MWRNVHQKLNSVSSSSRLMWLQSMGKKVKSVWLYFFVSVFISNRPRSSWTVFFLVGFTELLEEQKLTRNKDCIHYGRIKGQSVTDSVSNVTFCNQNPVVKLQHFVAMPLWFCNPKGTPLWIILISPLIISLLCWHCLPFLLYNYFFNKEPYYNNQNKECKVPLATVSNL